MKVGITQPRRGTMVSRIRVLVVEVEREGRRERGLRGKISRVWWRIEIEEFEFCIIF